MGAAIDTGDKKSVDVNLNITPFVDLMVCLTAFLLVTAVWTNLAQINIKPKGIGQDSNREVDEQEFVKASILITTSDIWVGLSRINDFRQISKTEGGEYNWQLLSETLQEHRKSSHLSESNPYSKAIEIGAEDEVEYQTMIWTMDKAIAAGFEDVGLSDPSALSARPQL